MSCLHFSFEGETRTIKCGADERRRRGLDRAEPLSALPAQMQTSLATRTFCVLIYGIFLRISHR